MFSSISSTLGLCDFTLFSDAPRVSLPAHLSSLADMRWSNVHLGSSKKKRINDPTTGKRNERAKNLPEKDMDIAKTMRDIQASKRPSILANSMITPKTPEIIQAIGRRILLLFEEIHHLWRHHSLKYLLYGFDCCNGSIILWPCRHLPSNGIISCAMRDHLLISFRNSISIDEEHPTWDI